MEPDGHIVLLGDSIFAGTGGRKVAAAITRAVGAIPGEPASQIFIG